MTLDLTAWWEFVRARAVPGVERLGEPPERSVRRLVPTPVGPQAVTIRLGSDGADDALVHRERAWPPNGAEIQAGTESLASVRRWLGADLDLGPARVALAEDPLMAPLLAARPALGVPGAVDPAELALRTVLGQQVSLGAAATFAGRLAARLGEPVGDLRAFPTPTAIASAGEGVREVGLTGGRTRTLLALAAALADGLDLAGDPASARRELAALPGIGPWTVEYVALRAMRDLDAFPAHDLVLRRRLGVTDPREALAIADRWRPWRGFAAQLLWSA
ncbi:3-methyladenine DNA glycosylase 2 [Actinotalea sp. M2MS4P-6]|uniref:DNA-3-methyladenine glycosylase family protein n=1 Tax=Actinotalea sp. M2MS4P-6 TaxID=2983762 RepID=UPI0021E3F428|nr:AlkA N-terminal domain-containing protein [Actinotalea sp. M2MS4P-6]MCV2395271.1 3-methyladenine DNA glycosylase 2 [Actinotalea sp. M2MS4P-6]